MRRYTTLLFDADRTLFDFDAAEKAAFGIVMNRFGIQYTDGDFECYKSINGRMWELFEKSVITKEELQRRRFSEFLETLPNAVHIDGMAVNNVYVEVLGERSELFPGAEGLCRRLSEKYSLYIVTNGVTRTQKKRFYASSVEKYFDGIFVSEEAGAPKPRPEYFDHVFGVIGEDKRKSSVIIGDSPSNDIAGGIIAGIDTVYYDQFGNGCPDGIVPTKTVKSYYELEAWLSEQE